MFIVVKCKHIEDVRAYTSLSVILSRTFVTMLLFVMQRWASGPVAKVKDSRSIGQQ